jgi:hypothetical protein
MSALMHDTIRNQRKGVHGQNLFQDHAKLSSRQRVLVPELAFQTEGVVKPDETYRRNKIHEGLHRAPTQKQRRRKNVLKKKTYKKKI